MVFSQEFISRSERYQSEMERADVLSCEVCSFEFDELSVITLAEKGLQSFYKLCETNVAEENLRFKRRSNEVLLCEICSFQVDEPSAAEGHQSFHKLCDKRIAEENLIEKCRNWVSENQFTPPSNSPSEQSANSEKLLHYFKKELDRLEDLFSIQTDEISKLLLELSIRLEVTRKNFSQLQEIKRNKNITNEVNLEKIIFKMKNDYNETREILGLDSEEQLHTTDSFENLNRLDNFLLKIFHKSLNGEKIFSVSEFGDERKFGKISAQKNFLFFHALDLTHVPTNASLINFEEAKHFLVSKSFGIFITISLKKNKTCDVIIEMLKTPRSNKVVGLCLGQFGSSYKNAFQIGYGNKFMLMDVILEQKSSSFNWGRHVDYFRAQNNEGSPDSVLNIPQNAVLAQEILNDGSFSLIVGSSVSERSDDDTFGIVIYPSNIRELLNSEKIPTVAILDCGIAINVLI